MKNYIDAVKRNIGFEDVKLINVQELYLHSDKICDEELVTVESFTD